MTHDFLIISATRLISKNSHNHLNTGTCIL